MMGFAGDFFVMGNEPVYGVIWAMPRRGIAVYDQSWEADGSTKFLQVVFFMETMYIHQSHSNCQPVLVLKEIVFLLIFLIRIFESTLVFVYVHSVACRIKDTSRNI